MPLCDFRQSSVPRLHANGNPGCGHGCSDLEIQDWRADVEEVVIPAAHLSRDPGRDPQAATGLRTGSCLPHPNRGGFAGFFLQMSSPSQRTDMKKHRFSLFAGFLLVCLLSATGYSGDVTYTYDQLNRLIGAEYPDGTGIEYTYDDIGNRIIQNVLLPSVPGANFTASPTSGPPPLSVTFTDQSTGSVNSWSWNFGDGGSSTSQNPVYTYSSAGTYTVILTVSNSFGSSSSATTIKVNPPLPVANFTASSTSGAIPFTVSFTDTSTGGVNIWSWNFGDGGTSTSQDPSHTYTSPGTYTVTLTVGGPTGTSIPKTASITAIPPPMAGFSAAPTSGTVPLAVQFTDASTGSVTGWSWIFGDGGTSTSQNPSHTYTSPGTYTVTLTASGPGGNSAPVTTSITVTPPPPVADFSATPTSGTAPLTVQFTDSSTGVVTGWSWAFGDGGASTSQNPSHTYTIPGNYTVTLTASGPGGNSSPATTSITVTYPAPVANFSFTPTNGIAPLSVQFTDASTGSVTSWSWVFGDGGTSTSQNPSHTYSTPGTYTVSLTATGPGGSNTNTKISYITVNATSPGIDQYTKLMVHFNGPNGSRTFTDSEQTPKTITGYGNAQISTAYSKFGGASLKLDGTGSYLSASPGSDWNFSGDFTIDFWWYQPATGTVGPIVAAGNGYSLVIQNYSGIVYAWISSNGSSWDIASQVRIGTPSGTGFDHYALVRSGNTYYTFQNGILTNSFVSSLHPYYSASNSLYIGGHGSYYGTGYLDELRISNGVARWASNFTPPSLPYIQGSVCPSAAFSVSPASGPAQLPVQFTDTSTGDISSWSWDFGDGSTSTAQYPDHIYSTAGTYTVSLTATGLGGSNTYTSTNCITITPSNGIDQYTKLMLHLDGPNGSTTFTDSEQTPKTITGYGNAQISTAYSKFGGASLKLNGTGSYLSAPAGSDWNFSGNFTIDFWWYQTATGTVGPIVAAGNGYSLVIQNYSGIVYAWISSNGLSWDIASQVRIGTPSGTGFDHYALVRSGNTYYTFQNGILTNSFVSSLHPYYSASNSLYIGGHGGYYGTGYLDEIRVSNGVARWLSNFTPPGAPYGN